MAMEQEIKVSRDTERQMMRFRSWIISKESRGISVADKGILYNKAKWFDDMYRDINTPDGPYAN